MTVHFKGQCIPCKNVICNVNTETKWNKTQPQLVMQGFAKTVRFTDNETVVIE